MDRRSKSHPHLSKTQTGMTNDWLSRPGLDIRCVRRGCAPTAMP